MKKDVRIKVLIGIWWVKWLKHRIGQGCLYHVIIPGHSNF